MSLKRVEQKYQNINGIVNFTSRNENITNGFSVISQSRQKPLSTPKKRTVGRAVID